EWVNLDPAATFTLASHNYLIKEAGGGVNVFQDNVLLADETMLDYQVLVTYIVDHLQGQLGAKYSGVEGRITVL
ncbi:MAG: hypothetical protein IJC51_03385, partial [Eggerthellaceae bacterium]|nr:hypothetical protein [Eggerthellaceae bacterium]